jgi:nucleotide-binding universal stress UspA family protein
MSWLEGKVAVALDGSAPSNQALKYAAELASRLKLGLVLLHVLEVHKVGYWRFIDEHFRKELERRAEEVILEGRKEAASLKVEVESNILPGTEMSAYEALVDHVANNAKVSHLIMGDHGVGLSGGHCLGSTTERVIREVASRRLLVAVVVVPARSY